MAKEASLWQRCRKGIDDLRKCGYELHMCRIENTAGEGHPDIEGCISGSQVWIELKSNARPVRPTTPIRSKTRESQSIWHRARTNAGSQMHWVLIQVGHAHQARLYLIPGHRYDEINVVESALTTLSVCRPQATLAEILLRAAQGW